MDTIWVREEDVLGSLGLDACSPEVHLCIDAAEAQVQSWRSDITDWTTVQSTNPDVYLAGVRLSALLYQHHTTPSGFAGFDSAGGIVIPEVSQMHSIRMLARAYRPRVG